MDVTTMVDIVDHLQSEIDDAAALAAPTAARLLGLVLTRMGDAARLRGEAIRYRLNGQIQEALRLEASSEREIAQARELLG